MYQKASSNAHWCWTDAARGGAWLQSVKFDWVGQDSLTVQKTVKIGDNNVGA
jgi:hypothetical protein